MAFDAGWAGAGAAVGVVGGDGDVFYGEGLLGQGRLHSQCEPKRELICKRLPIDGSPKLFQAVPTSGYIQGPTTNSN